MPVVDGKLKLTMNAAELETVINSVPDHSSAHESAGSDPIDVKNLAGYPGDTAKYLNGAGVFASPSVSVAYGTTAGTACEGDDQRLSNTRTPTAHAASHALGEYDAIELADILSLPGDTSLFLNSAGLFSAPAGTSVGVKPWVTIGVTGSGADYICDGASDNAQFQDLVDDEASGSEILILPGDYNFISQVSCSGKNFKFRGVGDVNINLNTGENFGFYFYGAAAASATTLSASPSAGNMSISVTSASGMAVGQNIIIYDDNDWSPYYSGLKTGEMHEIKSISGTTIYLNDPLMRSYSTSDSSSAKTFSTVSVKFENINFIGPTATGNQLGLGFRYGNKITVQNCTFKNCGLSDIYLYSCYDVNVTNNTINNSEMSGMGYGVAVSTASAKVRIENNTINSCRHCISCTSDLIQHGMNRDIVINGNVLYSPITPEGVIDSHPNTIDMIVTNNIIHSYNGRGFDDGSQISTFANNHVYGGIGVHIRDSINYAATHIVTGNYVPDGPIYYDVSATDLNELIVSDNICLGGDTQIYVYYKNIAEAIKITNNILKNATLISIRVPLENQSEASVIDISGNSINDCAREAIYLVINPAYTNCCTVSQNTIRNANTSNGSYPAMRVMGVTYGTIIGNSIIDKNAYNGSAIIIDTGSSYNTIIGNAAMGMTGTKYIYAGENDIKDHNIGA